MMDEHQYEVWQQLSLGYALYEQGLFEDVIHCYQQGLSSCPGNAELWYSLGTILLEMSRLSEAIEALRKAIAYKPDFADAYMNLGGALNEQNLSEDAIQCYQQGVAVCPDNAELWFNLGTTLFKVQRPADAVTALQQAIALKLDLISAYINLGNAHLQLQRPAEAAAAQQQAIALNPDFAGAYTNLGIALQTQGKVEDAIAAYDRAIALDPLDPDIYNNRAVAILQSGDLVRGFAEYEWRTKSNQCRYFYEWYDDKPRWCGENFAGKRLLVYHEQGYGDTLQFCRYLPLVKARGGSVQFTVPKPLLRLFSDFPGIDELIEQTEERISCTQFDLSVPLMSLPHIFGTTLPTIPAAIPYLTANQHLIAAWRSRLNCPGTNLRVGLVWAGNQANIPGQTRTCSLQAMSPLAGIPGMTFYSLQKGEAANEAYTPPPGMRLIDLTDDLADFADTAALIINLDLVVSVDTAVAHLAGALGKPVWTLLSTAGSWQWLLARNDTPWYPTMRLFRQSAPGDWDSVMTAVAQELKMWKAGAAV